MKIIEEKFDVVVIGGGPAGMLAAGRAAELGAKVVLLEKNKDLGKKLLLTGNGRCNLTQAKFKGAEFIKKLNHKNAKFLFSALTAFDVDAVRNFFEQRGLLTKVENTGKVFPLSDKAWDVLHVLAEYLRRNSVEIIYQANVKGFEMSAEAEDKKIMAVNLTGRKIYADKFILATGGKSYPITGSTGDGYAWAKEFGHTIILPKPGLAPIRVKESCVKEFQGICLEDAHIGLWQEQKKHKIESGEIIFTHFGLSGPMALSMSNKITELMENRKEISIEIDLMPGKTNAQLDAELQADFKVNINKDLKNYLASKLAPKLSLAIITLLGVDEKKKINIVSKEERLRLLGLLKSLRLTVEGVMGFERAMVTCGGVDVREVDSKTMQSKIVKNLYFAGEILDLDGPTGGYNLQICWSTGFAAGSSVVG